MKEPAQDNPNEEATMYSDISSRAWSGETSPLRIAVVGSGISGLSAAWLLSKKHRVTLFEADHRPGGHSNTVNAQFEGESPLAVDTGFIVFNELTYPNLCALFEHLQVPNHHTEMSFGISLNQGGLEYAGTDLNSLFAQRSNLVSPRFWRMLMDLVRFYREAPKAAASLGMMSLNDYLNANGYSESFRQDHLYPMAAAIWSTPAGQIGEYPVASFVRFCENHHLLDLGERPLWRTVRGGSIEYVKRILADFKGELIQNTAITSVDRTAQGVMLSTAQGQTHGLFDQVVIATHANQALRMLAQPTSEEQRLLGAFDYSKNTAYLHTDAALMPKRRKVWSSWNYLSTGQADDALCVTYWMNKLQHLPQDRPLFVTLNPPQPPAPDKTLKRIEYEHPIFDLEAMQAQQSLWSLQGQNRTWYCGAHFGSGFHEDGLQAGLAVAEQLGGVRRPWTVDNESGRIFVTPRTANEMAHA
jgi:predicted NAD/FAD-binding protein